MKIKNVKISELNLAEYNPRVELCEGMAEYDRLKNSLKKFGFVVPVIVNKNNNTVVGGHQRIKVWQDLGNTEVPIVEKALTEEQEKQLNLALNKVEGVWNKELLLEVLEDLDNIHLDLTGYSAEELGFLRSEYVSYIDDEFIRKQEEAIEDTFNLTLDFPTEEKEKIKRYAKEYGKETIAMFIIEFLKKEGAIQ